MLVCHSKTVIVGLAFVAWSGSALALQCFAPNPPSRLTPAQQRAVVLNVQDNKAVFNSDFSLMRTLKNIVGTAPNRNPSSVSDAEAKDLLKTLLVGFGATKLNNEDGNISFNVIPRGGEQALTADDLLDPSGPMRMVPVALFNRIDLAPADHAHCGEYRIVYAKSGPRGSNGKVEFNKRMTLIFEAALPNPDPSGDRAQCEAVWRLWKSFASNSNDAQIGQKLARFYFEGGKLDTQMEFQPVVHFSHYGVIGAGQVRANAFVTDDTSLNWHLRQWEVHFDQKDPNKAPNFEAKAVNETPFRGYFSADPKHASPPPGTDPGRFNALTGQFQSTFVSDNVSFQQLLAVDALAAIPGPPTITVGDLINHVGVNIDDKFYAVEADAGTPGGKSPDDPIAAISTNMAFKSAIAQRIKDLKVGAACGTTSDHVLNRMGAMTCGGCHQFSNTKEIAPNVKWPSSLTFVHVNEDGELSDLLKDRFLPFRFSLMDKLPAAPPAAFQGPLLTTLRLQKDLRDRITTNFQATTENIQAVRNLSEQIKKIDKSQPGAFVAIRKPD